MKYSKKLRKKKKINKKMNRLKSNKVCPPNFNKKTCKKVKKCTFGPLYKKETGTRGSPICHLKKKYKKIKKKTKKRGGASIDWLPINPNLATEPSAVNWEEAKDNIRETNKLLDNNPSCKTNMNCVPLATSNIYGISDLGDNTGDVTGIDENELKNWIEEMPPSGTSLEMAKEQGLFYMTYYRNFSSRPAIPEDGEVNEKIWTDEPMIKFIEKLLKSGLFQKKFTRGYTGQNPNLKFYDGCIHIALYKKNLESGWHDVNLCINEGEIFIIDLQLFQLGPLNANEIRGRIGPEMINQYLGRYSPNHFAIITEDEEKYNNHDTILLSRLNSISFNEELNNQQIKKVMEPHGTEESWNFRIWNLFSLSEMITPKILSYPYNVPFFNSGTKKILMPLLFNIDKYSKWPNSVKEKAEKYSQFQDNKYPQIIRETALTAILNAEDDVVLDHLANLAPKPVISLGEQPTITRPARAAEENQFNNEVGHAAYVLMNNKPGVVSFDDFGTLSGLAKIQANQRHAKNAAEN